MHDLAVFFVGCVVGAVLATMGWFALGEQLLEQKRREREPREPGHGKAGLGDKPTGSQPKPNRGPR